MPHEPDPEAALDQRKADPSPKQLAREAVLRSEISVAELVELDLDNPATPSRRDAAGEPEPGTFDVPLLARTERFRGKTEHGDAG